MSRVKYEPQRSAAEYRAMSRGDDPDAVTSAEHERPMPVDHAEAQRKIRAEDEARAGLLMGAVAGPWRVTHIEGDWVEITHIDKSTRLLKAYAVAELLRGARQNGLASVRAKEPEAPKPIEAIPFPGSGDPTTKGWE